MDSLIDAFLSQNVPTEAPAPDALTYAIRDTLDPEERLEDAVMFKVLHDLSGGKIIPKKDCGEADFGTTGSIFKHKSTLHYWKDRAFLENCGRKFEIVLFDDVASTIKKFHRDGMDVFVKSCLDKYFITIIRQGDDIDAAFGDMAYSFIDSSIPLMIQELVDFTYEHRFFCVDGEVLTHSPSAYSLTPLDYPTPSNFAWRKQASPSGEAWFGFSKQLSLAEKVASQMNEGTAVIDIGEARGAPAVVEFNPLRLGQIGLFACNVRKLAEAIYAKAMETQRAETGRGSVHDTAVRKDLLEGNK